MTQFILGSTKLNKWLHQNLAEIIDGFDGSLLDNGLYACKNGIAAVYEKYANPNSSIYKVYFARENEPDAVKQIENDFYTTYEERYKTYEE